MKSSPFGTLELLYNTGKYLFTDQEKEGRELGITKAAEIYAPIFREADAAYNNLKVELEREKSDFKSRYKFWLDKGVFYEKKKERTKEDIDRLVNAHPQLRKHIDMNKGFGVSGAAYPTIDIGGFFADLLQGRMDEKRQKYFKIQFEETSKDWKRKITQCKLRYSELDTNRVSLTIENKQKIDEIIALVNNEKTEYEKVLETYNTLKSIIGA